MKKLGGITCPVAAQVIIGDCQATSCMYFKRSCPSRCGHAKLTESLEEQGTDRKGRKEVVMDFFRIDAEGLTESLQNVWSVLCLNEFFFHVHGKAVTEATHRELDSMADMESVYESWRVSSKKVSFQELLKSVAYLKQNLR